MSKAEERTSESNFEGTGESTEGEEENSCLWRRIWWKVAIVLVLVVAVAGIIAGKQKGPRKSPESGQVGGTIENPRAEKKAKTFPSDTVLATVNGEEITLAELESALEEMPQQYRSAFQKNRHGLLDQLIAREVLLQKAREGDATGEANEGTGDAGGEGGDPQRSEDERISALLQKKVLEDIEVTEQDVKAFYEKNSDQMPAGRSFEDLEDSLRSYARQEKRSEAVDAYLKKLREEATITRNKEWIEAQKTKAADNPLDKALQKDVPVLADFGRNNCVPCKMMKPILDDLKEQYAGRAEILIIQTDEYPGVTRRVGVRAIPTQIFYDAEGNEVDRHQGFMSREAIVKKLKEMGVN